MIVCPRCQHRFPESLATRDAFEFFHVLVDQYAKEQGMNKPDAKDTLCVLYGVSVEYEGQKDLPKWPMVACTLWGRRFLRKSTLAYTPAEMSRLIESSQEAVHTGEEE